MSDERTMKPTPRDTGVTGPVLATWKAGLR